MLDQDFQPARKDHPNSPHCSASLDCKHFVAPLAGLQKRPAYRLHPARKTMAVALADRPKAPPVH